MSVQSLSKGVSLQEKYGSYGHTQTRQISPLGRLFGLIAGFSNAGKSTMFLSNPAALILNLDLTSTPYPENTPAQFWPGIGPDGRPIDLDGTPMTLSWDKLRELKARLIADAQAGKPRPETIVFDTLGSGFALCRDYILAKSGKTEWRELHGQTAYDMLYEEIIRFGKDLKNAGYGFFFVTHLQNRVIPLDENRFIDRIELQMTDNFYGRLHPQLEFVAAVTIEDGTITESIPQKPVVVNGVERVIPPKTMTRQVRQRVLLIDSEELSKILRCKVRMPAKIVLPHTGGWQAVEAEYNKGVGQ